MKKLAGRGTGSNRGVKLQRMVVTAAMLVAMGSAVQTANAAGYSTFFYQPGQACGWLGVAKTYYESGSASSWVSVRGDFYTVDSGGNLYSLGPELTDYQAGGGAREARVAKNVLGYENQRVYGTHRGSPWGSGTNYTSADKAGYGC